MPYLEVLVFVVAIAFCALVIILIPTILAIKRTAESFTNLSVMLQEELKPAINELTAVLSEIKTFSGGVAEHTGDITHFMTALGETGSSMHAINRTIGNATGVLNMASVWVTGAKVAGKYFIERYLNKRRGV